MDRSFAKVVVSRSWWRTEMKLYVDSMDWWLNGVKAIVLSNWDFGRCNLEGRSKNSSEIYLFYFAIAN